MVERQSIAVVGNYKIKRCILCQEDYKPTGSVQKVCLNCKPVLRLQSVDRCSKAAHERLKELRRLNRENSKKWFKRLSAEKKLIRYVKSRSKARNLSFDLSPEDVLIPDFCPILGIKLAQQNGTRGPKRNSASIDRIDPAGGYTKNNIQIISMKANTMKNDATIEELQRFADWVLKTYPR